MCLIWVWCCTCIGARAQKICVDLIWAQAKLENFTFIAEPSLNIQYLIKLDSFTTLIKITRLMPVVILFVLNPEYNLILHDEHVIAFFPIDLNLFYFQSQQTY